MTLWFRHENGLVAEDPVDHGSVDPNEAYAPNTYARVPQGATVQQRMTWDGEKLGSPPLPSKRDLIDYAKNKQLALSTGGYTLNVAASGQPAKTVRADTDIGGRTNLSGLYNLAQDNLNFTTPWVQDSGVVVLDADQIKALAVAVGTFYSATYGALAIVVGEIQAGSLKTFADVDGTSAWPAASA